MFHNFRQSNYPIARAREYSPLCLAVSLLGFSFWIVPGMPISASPRRQVAVRRGLAYTACKPLRRARSPACIWSSLVPKERVS